MVSRRTDSTASTTSFGLVGDYQMNPTIISSQDFLSSRMTTGWSIVRSYVMKSNLNQTRRNTHERQDPTKNGLRNLEHTSGLNSKAQGEYFLNIK
jgi:hypothetical protein